MIIRRVGKDTQWLDGEGDGRSEKNEFPDLSYL